MKISLYDNFGLSHWVKRFFCGILAVALIYIGMNLTTSSAVIPGVLGFCIFIIGITLAHIAIMQQFPKYNFWITLTAIGLAYALYNTHFSSQEKQIVVDKAEVEIEKSTDIAETNVRKKSLSKKATKKKTGFNLAAYPKITGSITVINANTYVINGRYVRLYGVDAPDLDQICADARGAAYNCGEEAASWIRGWIDKNPIDCYILKVVPNGQNLATCVWGEYDIGAALVGSGWGIAQTTETTIYKPYEVKAQSEYSGLWQGTFYSPADWRDIKRHRRDFKINHRAISKKGSFFNNLKSLF